MTTLQPIHRELRRPELRVAVVCGGLLNIGGGETYLLQLFEALPNIEFWLLAPATKAFVDKLDHRSNVSWESWTPVAWFDGNSAYRLYKELRRLQIDLVHVNDARALMLAGMICCLVGLPVVRVVQIPAYYYANGPFKRVGYTLAERLMNRFFTAVTIYLSSRVRREAIALGVTNPKRSRVIPQGIALSKFQEPITVEQRTQLRAESGASPHDIILTFVGRLAPEKQIPLLVETFAQVANKHSLAHLWIVGEGPDKAIVSKSIRRLKLEDRVHLLGFREDVSSILQASDIFVLCSAYEAGAPIVVLEAMASGLPCVVTDVGECTTLLDREAGIVVPRNDVRALGKAIERLIADPGTRNAMGRAARQRALEYDARTMSMRTLEVYREAIAHAGR